MPSTEALQELLSLSSPGPVLSVYLNTDLTRGNFSQFQLSLRSLLRGVEAPADEAAILDYYQRDRRWSGKSLAMFSCAAAGYFRAIPFAVPVQSFASVGNQPYVKPLVDLMDAHGHIAAVLVDKHQARLFFAHMGEIEEHDGFEGHPVKHTKRGGASSFPGRRGGIAGRTRHAEEMVDQNIKDAAQLAVGWFERQGVRRIVVSGADENVHQFRSYLPRAWAAAVIGTSTLGLRARPEEVLKQVREISERAALEREARLVSRMITASAKGGPGAVELEDTLRALREGRIQLLLVDEGYRAAGYRCHGCGYLTAKKLYTCPFCGNKFGAVEDAVELAIRETLKAGGEIEIVRGNAELRRLRVGALLRF